MLENSRGFQYEKSTDFGIGDSVRPGRRAGQDAPIPEDTRTVAAPRDGSAQPAQREPAKRVLAGDPLAPQAAVQPPVNHYAALLRMYGDYPSMKHPNGPVIAHLKVGQLEFNPFVGKWINGSGPRRSA